MFRLPPRRHASSACTTGRGIEADQAAKVPDHVVNMLLMVPISIILMLNVVVVEVIVVVDGVVKVLLDLLGAVVPIGQLRLQFFN